MQLIDYYFVFSTTLGLQLFFLFSPMSLHWSTPIFQLFFPLLSIFKHILHFQGYRSRIPHQPHIRHPPPHSPQSNFCQLFQLPLLFQLLPVFLISTTVYVTPVSLHILAMLFPFYLLDYPSLSFFNFSQQQHYPFQFLFSLPQTPSAGIIGIRSGKHFQQADRLRHPTVCGECFFKAVFD